MNERKQGKEGPIYSSLPYFPKGRKEDRYIGRYYFLPFIVGAQDPQVQKVENRVCLDGLLDRQDK